MGWSYACPATSWMELCSAMPGTEIVEALDMDCLCPGPKWGEVCVNWKNLIRRPQDTGCFLVLLVTSPQPTGTLSPPGSTFIQGCFQGLTCWRKSLHVWNGKEHPEILPCMLSIELSLFFVVHRDSYKETEGLKGWRLTRTWEARRADSKIVIKFRESPAKQAHSDEAGPRATCRSGWGLVRETRVRRSVDRYIVMK